MTEHSSPYSQSHVVGAGIGLRTKHVQEVIQRQPRISWFEVLTDNYFGPGGSELLMLEKIRANYPITMHSVGMSIGSTDPLDMTYLTQIKELADRFQPAWISEHLCWTSAHGVHFHDLLPLPYEEETIEHVAARIRQIQDLLGRQILIENVSSYLSYKQSSMTEWDFVSQVAERADCYILLDINNIYVSSQNHEFDALEYISSVPHQRVKEIHLAGFEDRGDFLLDSHSTKVDAEVWKLYAEAVRLCGQVATLIEWDNEIPALEVLIEEASHAQAILDSAQPTQSQPQECAA